MEVTASNGCKFHVVGWIDISYNVFNNNVSVNGYDVTATGTKKCGTFHFQGLLHPTDGNDADTEVPEELLKKIVTEVIDVNIN